MSRKYYCELNNLSSDFCVAIFNQSVQVFADDDDEVGQDKREICSKLSRTRESYHNCCSIPRFYSQDWMVQQCKKNCAGWTKTFIFCCVNSCLYESKGILKYERNENGSITKIVMISWEGFVDSFMMGLKNDSGWLSIINNSVQSCFYQFAHQDLGNICGDLIPKAMTKTIDCCNKQNFLNCANWNPIESRGCENTRKYVDNCMEDVRFVNQMPLSYKEPVS